MYRATVYKIMIGAPSDIQEEIQIAKNVIHRWNVINSEYQRRVLLPLHWSDNAYPLAGEHPQKTIDKTVVVKVASYEPHPKYKKIMETTTNYKAHDEQNQCSEGDIVRIVESKPISGGKRWVVSEIVEKVK